MSEQNLPSGWVCSTLGLVCSKLTDGSHNPPKGTAVGQPMLSAKNIQNGIIDFRQSHRLIPAELFESEDRRTSVSAHDVLLTIVGALGRTAVVPENCGKFTLQRSVAVLAAPGLNTKAFRYSLESYDFQQQILDNAKGTAQKGIYLKKLRELTVPIPPLAEQKVIADKLDTLLAQVENTKSRLERIPHILKRFRQSVLAAAVSGRLTEEWRATQGTSLESWQQTTFQKICREITVGFVGRMANRYEESGVPFLRSQNVRAFRYSDKNLLYISPAFHQEIYKSRLEPGDLAIVRSGAPGTTCVIPKSLGAANCSDLVIARPSPHLLPEFGCIFMNSEVARKNVSDNQVGVAQQHFNVGSMKKMPIHLPPVDEQTEIVRRVDQLFAHADRIEQQVNNALARVNNLTQSILAKAFRGELTEQWRKDNPELISGENSAEALLERIKAERAAVKPAKKTRKRAKS